MLPAYRGRQIDLPSRAIILGMDDDLAVVARAGSDVGGELDGGRHDEAIAVIGVLADEVDTSGSTKETRFAAKHLAESGAQVLDVHFFPSFSNATLPMGHEVQSWKSKCHHSNSYTVKWFFSITSRSRSRRARSSAVPPE